MTINCSSFQGLWPNRFTVTKPKREGSCPILDLKALILIQVQKFHIESTKSVINYLYQGLPGFLVQCFLTYVQLRHSFKIMDSR